MNSKNALLIVVAIIAIIGWVFAISAFIYPQAAQVPQDGIAPQQPSESESQSQVGYSLYTTGNYPCIVMANNSTAKYNVAVGNVGATDVVVDFIVAARNADVSWDESAGFNQSSSRRMTVLAGTQGHLETFYIRPDSGTDNLSLSMDAKAVDPTNIAVQNSDLEIITYYKDDSGNYCH